MQPEQPYTPPAPAPEPSHPSQYDFIMNGGQPQPKSKLSLPKGNGSKTQRILILVGGGAVLLVLILMAFSLLTAGSKGQTEQLLTLAQEQTELIRVAGLAQSEKAVRSSSTQVLAANTSLALQSSNKEVLALLTKAKVKTDDKILALKKSSKTDLALEEAAQNNQYDDVFTGILRTDLKAYQTHVKQLYSTSTNKAQKEVLDAAYRGTTILLGESTK